MSSTNLQAKKLQYKGNEFNPQGGEAKPQDTTQKTKTKLKLRNNQVFTPSDATTPKLQAKTGFNKGSQPFNIEGTKGLNPSLSKKLNKNLSFDPSKNAARQPTNLAGNLNLGAPGYTPQTLVSGSQSFTPTTNINPQIQNTNNIISSINVNPQTPVMPIGMINQANPMINMGGMSFFNKMPNMVPNMMGMPNMMSNMMGNIMQNSQIPNQMNKINQGGQIKMPFMGNPNNGFYNQKFNNNGLKQTNMGNIKFTNNKYNAMTAQNTGVTNSFKTMTTPPPTPLQNFSTDDTKKLALKLKMKKEEEEKKRLEEESKREGNSSEDEENSEDDDEDEDSYSDSEDQAAEEAIAKKADDNIVEEVEEEQENYDDLPQERPVVIRYTKQMILDFIAKESVREFPDEYIFDDLEREVTIVTRGEKGFSQISRMSNNNRRGGGGGRGGGTYNKRGGDRYQRGGGKYNSDRNNYDNGSGNATLLLGQNMTKEQRDKMKEVKKAAGEDWAKKNQEGIDELEAVKRNINLELFKLTEENFETGYSQLKKFCNNEEHCKILVNLLVNKAWNQSSYIRTYSKMCLRLGNENTYSWAKGNNEQERQEDSKKRFKGFVVNKIRKEFLQGFKNYKETTEKNEKDEEIEEDEVFEKYNKDKKKLTGNMEFISELYKLGYLPHKVMRFITTKIITQFTEEYANRDKSFEFRYPVYDELLEALINLFAFCGSKIQSRERKSAHKRAKEKLPEQCPYNLIVDFCEYLVECCQQGKYSSTNNKKIISDEARKNANCINMTFTFFDMVLAGKIVGPRISSLIINAKENKESGFRLEKKAKGPMKLKDFHDKLEAEKEKARGARRYGGGSGTGGGGRRRGERDRDYDNAPQYTKKRSGYGRGYESGIQRGTKKSEGKFISTNDLKKKGPKE